MNIILHVSAGIIAMAMGIVAYASVKGGKTHRKFGRLFLAFIGVVILTATTGVLVFVDRPFLAVVTLQSAYFAYSGFRATKLKEKPLQLVDFGVLLLAIVVVVRFFAGMGQANIVWNSAVVLPLLYYVSAVLAFDLLRFFAPGLIRSPKFWIYDHIFRITGAFTALASAGVGTVLGGDWAPWSQIVPAVLGTCWLVFCLLYFPRRWFNSSLKTH